MESTRHTPDRTTCFGAKLCAELKRLVVLVIVAGLILIAGKYYGFDRLNEEVRTKVEKQLREHYQGLSVTVKSARRIAGKGVEIRGVRIAEAGGKTAPVLAEIDEIFAECDTRLPDFLTKPPQIVALHVQRMKLRAERKATGQWNLSHLLPLPGRPGESAPVASISDASLEIVDATQMGAGNLLLRNIELSVAPEATAGSPDATAGAPEVVLRVRGTLAGDHVDRVEIDGTLDPVTSRWEVRGSVEGLEFSPRLRAGLPRELSAALAPLSSVRGRTFFGFHAWREGRMANPGAASNALIDHAAPGARLSQGERKADEVPIQFVVHGRISEGRIDDARLPEPLTDVEATIRCDNFGVRINELAARCGPTQVELTASIMGYSGTQPIDMKLTARQLRLEHVPMRTLPPTMRETWGHFAPRGLVDVSGRLQFDGGQWRPDLKFECHDLSLTYDKFPYRVTDGSGTVFLKPESLTASLRLVGGGRFIVCRAQVRDPGTRFTGWIELSSEGPVAIDEKLIAAMDPPMQRLVRGFWPRGSASFFARFARNPGEQIAHRHLEVQLHECSIQHERFAYPIDRVNGTLAADDENWTFKNLVGRNDSAVIGCEGIWGGDGQAGRQLRLQFTAGDVPLADELRQALPVAAQGLWSNLRPRGNIDRLTAELQYASATKRWSLEFGAEKRPAASGGEGRSISLEATWFRYALNNVTGGFRYRDGRMELSNLRATHGRANMAAEGNCAILPDGGCRLELSRMSADRVEVDRELLAALPAGVGQSLGRIPLDGPVNMQGRLAIVAPPQPEAAPQVNWDVDLDVENGRLLTATPVEHIYGGVSLSGRQNGEGLFARGELKVDSAMIRGIQLANVQGPYWFDGRQLVFGAFADRDTKNGAPRQVTARLLGGLFSADGMVLSSDGTFDVQATLANADLREIGRELTPNQPPAIGKVFGLVQIGGNAQGKHTWHGGGKVNLREADLYQLPAMITLLKLLSIQRPDSTAFTNSNIDFRIEGDDLAFDRIDFSGDAISLKGKGRMNGQRQIDLKFYPLVGREERQLPIFRQFLGQTGQEFMLIEVTGNIDQPEITRTPFPRLDAPLAELFPELARDESVEPKAPARVSSREGWNRLWPGSWR